MQYSLEERACDLAVYIVENRATVRAAAKKFGVSKSTVHTDRTIWNCSSGGWRRD
ncbi:MAG: sporulation transcriptional regulator SpoIIID [Oscillospiraceae bacterium]|nr:sporulation transcriptional regulator SpoIIID [Oscillospiraceae bacterium]